jgi:hypothetical protein
MSVTKILACLAAGVAVSGCAVLSSSSPPAPRSHHDTVALCSGGKDVRTLVVTRHLLNPGTFSFPASVTVKRERIIDRLVAAICSLPAEPLGARSCPIDVGPTYRLVFTTDDGRVAKVVTDPTGCATVSSPSHSIGTKGFGFRETEPRFWRALGVAVGVKDATRQTFVGRSSPT